MGGGRFWAFHSAGISIVNPKTCSIERNITKDQDGNDLPRKWFDGVYMEPNSPLENHRRGLHEERTPGFILINSAENVYDDHSEASGEVLVLSTSVYLKEDEVVHDRVLVGPRPVHSYAVHTRDEFWTHSDGDGQFYVIKLENVARHTGKPIVAKVQEAYHGKLLWDESVYLDGHGFATSVGERTLFMMDMKQHELIGFYNYTENILPLLHPNYCMGTHAIAYSSANFHLYLECVGGGGILEIDVGNPLAPVFVHQHKEASGALYEIPDGSAVVAADKGKSKLFVFRPNGAGQASSIEFEVDVPGNPSTPSFYPNIDGSYTACMPLTENTNINHQKDGKVVCDVYNCGGATTPEDVASGICAYNSLEPKLLLEAPLDDIENVKAGLEPYNGACNRCKDKGNYDGGKCQCTPFCGSCAEPNYDDSGSGVQCVNLGDVFSNMTQEATLIEGAGAVKQSGPQSDSPVCGFGRTYRAHKRGGIYDASIADIPFSSLQIVNMFTQELKCRVELPGNPDRVIYVPLQPGQTNNIINAELEEALTDAAIAGIVIASLVVAGFLAWFIHVTNCCMGKPEHQTQQEVTHEMQTSEMT